MNGTPKGFDPSTLIAGGGKNADPPPDDEPLDEEDIPEEDLPEGEGAEEESVEDPAAEPAGKAEAKGDEDDFEDVSLEDIDERTRASVKQALDDYRKEREAEDAAAEAAEKGDDKDREIARLNGELDRERKKSQAQAEATEMEKAVHEIVSCVGKYAMSDQERDMVVNYFQQNPDLVGVVPFERAALRVMPELAGRVRKAPAERNGDSRANGTKVVTRGASGAPPANPPKFTGGRMRYGDVTDYLKQHHAASLFKVR